GGKSDADVLYAPSTTGLDVHGPQEGEISFTGSTSDGHAIEKRYRFTGNSYLFAVDVVGSGSGDRGGIVPTPVSEQGAGGSRQSGHELAVAFANQKVIEKAPDKLGEPSEIAMRSGQASARSTSRRSRCRPREAQPHGWRSATRRRSLALTSPTKKAAPSSGYFSGRRIARRLLQPATTSIACSTSDGSGSSRFRCFLPSGCSIA